MTPMLMQEAKAQEVLLKLEDTNKKLSINILWTWRAFFSVWKPLSSRRAVKEMVTKSRKFCHKVSVAWAKQCQLLWDMSKLSNWCQLLTSIQMRCKQKSKELCSSNIGPTIDNMINKCLMTVLVISLMKIMFQSLRSLGETLWAATFTLTSKPFQIIKRWKTRRG